MKRKQTRITDLHSDILKHIMIFVAKSSDGATSFARAISICKEFKELSTDNDILKDMVFGNVALSGINGSFWQKGGLLVRCAKARNVAAFSILLQHVKDLLKSARMNISSFAMWEMDVEEMIRIVKRQACTRAMSRRIGSSLKEMKMLVQAVNVEVQKAEELADAVI